MTVIGGHKLDPEFFAQLDEDFIDLFLFGDAIVLKLKVEPVAKELFEKGDFFPHSFKIPLED